MVANLLFEMKRNRKRLYRKMFKKASEILYRWDPAGIALGNPHLDECDLEVGTILPRLRDVQCEEEAIQLVHEEFQRWFGSVTVGGLERLRPAARDLWTLWLDGRDQ